MGRRLRRSRAPIVVAVLVIGLVAGVPRAAAGQAQATGSIVGRVTDESGAVLPGVTVTATSPALQVGEVVVVTDAQGDYRLTPLPIGTYETVYTLTGFQVVRREDLRVTAGFIARADVVLKVGALEETITVSGVSPVVDASSTSSVTALTRETLEVNPTGRAGIISLMNQSPSVRSQQDSGGSEFNSSPAIRVYGIGTHETSWLVLDGVVVTSAGQSGVGGSYFDYASFEEVRMQTIANDVEVPNRGLNLNMIVKSGGNDFHGSGFWEQTSGKLQSSNIDAALAAQGITDGNELKRRFDGSFDLGGRIIRNKLWFYSSVRGRQNRETVLQVFKPDGSQADENQAQVMETQKISYQMTPSQRIIGFDNFVHLWKDDELDRNATWDARSTKTLPEHNSKLEWQGVKGNSLVASFQVARWRISVDYPIRATGQPEQQDIFTLFRSGLNASAGNVVDHWRPMTKASLSWFRPDFFVGNHEFKTGYDDIRTTSSRGWRSREQGDYLLQFNNGVPYQLVPYNFPNRPLTTAHSTAVYGADKWTLGRRLTLNLGVRWSRDDGYIPAQCRDGGVFFESGCNDNIQARTMYSWSPRLYAAYDVMGDGKTALKGGWGRFSDWRNEDHVLPLNPNIALQRVYLWRDLNGNRDYDPGEVNLDTNGPDFVEEVGKGNVTIANTVANPNEPQTQEDQFSLSLEQELIANFGIRATGLYSRRFNVGRTENLLRGADVYTIAITRPDPGRDGRAGTADDPGTFLTYYEYPAAYSGRAFQLNTRVLDPGATETFTTIELAGSKRLSNRWQLLASYSATKSDIPVPDGSNINPNTLINAANNTWEWLGRVSGAYLLPAGVMVSANFEHRSGNVTARTVLLTGGRTIPSIRVNAEPVGSLRLPNINVTDLRVEKRFRLGDGKSVTGRINLFNVTNVNTTTAWIVASGRTFLNTTAVFPPRLLDFAVTYSF